jgi:acyl-CoA thioester hydrolase
MSLPTSTPTPGPWPAQRRFVVQYADVDALNHLNHAVYFRYMETLRCDYYMPILGVKDPRELDIIVAEATCRYLAPAGYGTELIGECAPGSPLGRTSFSLLYRFVDAYDTKRLYARGRTVVVMYDYASVSKKPIDGTLRSRFEKDAVPLDSEGWIDPPRP